MELNLILINFSKDEIDTEIINMSENCENYIKALKEYNKDNEDRYLTRRISFINQEDLLTVNFSLGYVETMCKEDNTTDYSEEEEETELTDDKYESLEAQLKEIPTKNQLVMKKTKAVKINSKIGRYKTIVESRKLSQNYRIIGSEGDDYSEFKHPLGVAVSPIDGNIYVADSWNNRLQIFDENGVFVKSIEKIDQNEFRYPYSIHIDRKGRIFVSDQSLIRIKVFDFDAKLNDLKLIKVIGKYGREVGCYSGLCDISTDKDNNIYVCDSGNHRILKFSENGEFMMQWGENGSNEGCFKCPACVTVHEERVIVSDWGKYKRFFYVTLII